jgi:hypothetical protein
MGRVLTHMTMSLDGYVAGPDDQVGELFEWYEAGGVSVEIADGWNDNHPVGAPVVVVTHSAPPDADERWPRTTFVDGVESAVAKAREIAATLLEDPVVVQGRRALHLRYPVRR